MLATISERGQITIPKKIRLNFEAKNFKIKRVPSGILLKPVLIIPEEKELLGFSDLSKSSLDFWNNDKDDIYADFYK